MMVAVFLGALSLGACVDDNETQSVTDVRNAKAEQLQARADMNNAEATARKITADADAALLVAKADAEAAVAAKTAAEVETIKKQTELIELKKEAANLKNEAAVIANKIKQTELETLLSNLAVTQADAEKTLKEVQARMDQMETSNAAALARAKANLAKAQADLLDYRTQLAAAATEAEKKAIKAKQLALATASSAYTAAVEELITSQQKLTKAKSDLTGLENGLKEYKVVMEQNIIDNNNTINRYEGYIDIYKEYTNYKTDEEIASLTDKVSELTAKQGLLSDEFMKTLLAYEDVRPDLKAKEEAQDAVEADSYYQFASNWIITVKDAAAEDRIFRIVELDNYRCDKLGLDVNEWDNIVFQKKPGINVYNGIKTYKVESGEHAEDITSLGDTLIMYPHFNGEELDVRTMTLRVNEMIDALKADKKAGSDALAVLKANYNGVATGYYQYGSFVEYAPDATEKLNAVQRTAAAKKAYEEDANKEWAKQQAYQNALDVEIWLKQEIANAEENVAEYDLKVKAFEAYLDFYANHKTYEAALQKKIDTRNVADVAAYADKVAAYKASRIAYWAYEDSNTEINAISVTLSGAETVAENIARFETAIKNLKAENEDYPAGIESKEKAIELQKLRVDRVDVRVRAAEAAVTDAKADLDALMTAE